MIDILRGRQLIFIIWENKLSFLVIPFSLSFQHSTQLIISVSCLSKHHLTQINFESLKAKWCSHHCSPADFPLSRAVGWQVGFKYNSCVAEASARWLHHSLLPLLQNVLKIAAHCPEIITRRASNKAVGREDVSERNSHHKKFLAALAHFHPTPVVLGRVFTSASGQVKKLYTSKLLS